MFLRSDTVKLNIGGVEMGGGSRISVQSMTNTDITKLIAVSRLDKIDKNLLKRFLDHSNYFTDFGTFRLNAEINQKLKLKPLGKK